MVRQRGGAIVPGGVVHTDVVFVVVAVVGLVALAAGLVGAVTGPGPQDIPTLAALAIVFGVPGTVAGCIGAPLVIAIAHRDRATLVLVRASRPRSLLLPGAMSNGALLRSVRALAPSVPTPRSVVWAVDESGMEMWQSDRPAPVLTIPWSAVGATETETMSQGRAVIAVITMQLLNGHTLRIALRRRFGGISLMGRPRLEDVIQDFADVARSAGASAP